MALTLDKAREIIDAALKGARERNLKPVTVAVLDAGGSLKAMAREDETSPMRPDIAFGKANGAIALGLGSRALFNRAQEQPYFIQAMNALADGKLVPVPGGVLIRENGAIIGAVGITGDTSDNDEACAIAAIEAAGFNADGG
ncbi:GlcG/HbpS family heme-binding protein [Tepidamorphus sp. 3E244]|uniref:GlcG/HbpS family heme-binding protein n=1 Tax=Tepidamorphus sp. 3E244 TaxID=3385498 RepID=UPI0038FD1A93